LRALRRRRWLHQSSASREERRDDAPKITLNRHARYRRTALDGRVRSRDPLAGRVARVRSSLHGSAHEIRHAAVTHPQEVSQNIAGAAYVAGHKRTATTAAYTHPNYAAGLAVLGARFGFLDTKLDTDRKPGDHEMPFPLVGTGGIEPPTPTVSSKCAARQGPFRLSETKEVQGQTRPICASPRTFLHTVCRSASSRGTSSTTPRTRTRR
jgi:hypothetical protein